MKRAQAIKAFFEADGGRKVSMSEMKALIEDKGAYNEVAELSAAALGVELES